jgi:hypothetical protein
MSIHELIINVKFPFRWEYGFGESGIGSYLFLWDDVVMFIKDNSTE